MKKKLHLEANEVKPPSQTTPGVSPHPERSKEQNTESASTKPRKKASKTARKNAQKPKVSAKAAAEADLTRRLADPLFPARALDGLDPLVFPREAMRLGFAVKVMGQPNHKSNDTRRWQQNPHLRVSLGYLAETFSYLRKHRIHMYRMSSDLAPYATHPTMPQFHSMVRDSAADLAYLGRLAREADIRLSFHPSQFIVLNSESEDLTRKSMADLDSQAEMLDLMECGPEAVLVVHVGGAYGDRASGCERWCRTWPRLSEPVRRRLVLENDDIRFSSAMSSASTNAPASNVSSTISIIGASTPKPFRWLRPSPVFSPHGPPGSGPRRTFRAPAPRCAS